MRFGYEPRALHQPDASHRDAGVMYAADAAALDAALDAAMVDARVAGSGGSAGVAGQQPTAGLGAGAGADAGGSSDDDAGAPIDPELGGTGLRVSDILGYYSGDWGDMVLERRSAEIWGVYNYNDGTIIGAVTADGVFEGWWSQLPTRADGINAGEVEFRWSRTSSGVIALDGRWRYGTNGTWLENWDVELVTDRSAPSELTDAFDDLQDFRRHP